MHEILVSLAAGARVLDLGARSGSFDPALYPGTLVVRLDLHRPAATHGVPTVQADAGAMPFGSGAFDVVIANHSLEHMTDLASVLAEIGRVVRRAGSLYVAVPDSSTVSDRIYRWVYHGGGHVNPFDSAAELDGRVTKYVGLAPAGHRLLHTSFGFLERNHFHPRPPRRMLVFLNGRYEAIVILGYLARILDRVFGTRFSVYGWAFYYGHVDGGVDKKAWSNVCVRCGSAQPEANLEPRTAIWPVKTYRCPSCRSRNLFTPDR
jgi:SAM-dependent methyltransferase